VCRARTSQTLTTMSNLAATLYLQGDLKGARELQEQVLEESVVFRRGTSSHTDGDDNLAATLKGLGDLTATRKLQNKSRDSPASVG